MNQSPGMWVAAIVTIVAYTVLAKPNKASDYLQNIYVGLASGYAVTLGIENILKVGWTPLAKGNTLSIVPLALGVMLLCRYYRPLRWLSGYPSAILVGIGTGLSVRGVVSAEIIAQMTATMVKLNSFDNVVIVFCTLTAIVYFIFTIGISPRSSLGASMAKVRELGRYSLLVMFGAAFAMGVQARLSLLIGRFQFLFQEWLGF